MSFDTIDTTKEKGKIRLDFDKDLEQFKFDLQSKLLDKQDELEQKNFDRKLKLLEQEIQLHKDRNEVAITVGAIQMGMVQAMVEGKMNVVEIREMFSMANKALAKLDEKKLIE